MTRAVLTSMKLLKHEMKRLEEKGYMDEYKILEKQYLRLKKMDMIRKMKEMPEHQKSLAEKVYYEDYTWEEAYNELHCKVVYEDAYKKAIERAIKSHMKMEI